MKKSMAIKFMGTWILFFTALSFYGQRPNIDSLRNELGSTKNDTTRLSLAYLLEDAFTEGNPDSALFYAELIKQLAIKLRLSLEEIYAMGKIGYALQNKGNYARSLQTYLSAITLAEDPASETNLLSAHYPAPDEITSRSMPARIQRLDKLSHLHQYMAILYSNTQNPEKALESSYLALELGRETQNQRLLCVIHLIMGRLFLVLNQPDSALLSEQRALEEAIRMDFPRYLGSIYLNIGRIHQYKGDRELAADFYRKALASSYDQNYFRGVVASNLLLAEYFGKDGNRDSSLFFIHQALDMARQMDAPDLLLRTYQAIANYYKPTVFTDSLVKYQGLIIRLNEDIFNIKQNQQFRNIEFDEQLRLQALEKEKELLRNRNRTYGFTIGLGGLLLIAFILYRNNRQKQRANAELEKTLSELKATQAQLIQAEKMASLGELTAGIAHEIQNPLNFINNFAEINNELLDEFQEERKKETGETEVNTAILQSIKENQEKILQHGKRADAIVKSMLEHSRVHSGQKEPTDLNALCDEFLRLAYHGLRAKDKDFNSGFKLEPDPDLPRINIVPQEIGRVLLNLINNAFFAVGERMRVENSEHRLGTVQERSRKGSQDYKPMVTVSTKKVEKGVEIRVKDNGAGIPEQIREKIFQPFFTTKPTGLGTGLGLSIAYDIVKSHGGILTMESEQGEGTEFLIQLS